MTARTLGGLQVPVRSLGGMSVPPVAKASSFAAVVDALLPGGRATVVIGADVKPASIAPTAKAIQVGDAVTVEKRGGTWWIVAVDTWHEPPTVARPTTASVPSAGNAASVSVRSLGYQPESPRANIGTTLASMQIWAESTRAWAIALEAWLTQVRHGHNELRDSDGAVRSAVANNASSANTARTVLDSTRAAHNALHDGAAVDRVIQ